MQTWLHAATQVNTRPAVQRRVTDLAPLVVDAHLLVDEVRSVRRISDEEIGRFREVLLDVALRALHSYERVADPTDVHFTHRLNDNRCGSA